MDDSQVAKTIGKSPQLMSYSLEENLKPKAQTLREYGFSDIHIVRVLSTSPALFGHSSKRWAHRFSVLHASGALKSHSSCSFLLLTDIAFSSRFESA
mmetsp:Transcript_71615/g.231774  ORF Transcript_71615/g.231774 Transcript_71615/m.231774 type:complete len:97 (+) Transcript_71615:3-293(+)